MNGNDAVRGDAIREVEVDLSHPHSRALWEIACGAKPWTREEMIDHAVDALLNRGNDAVRGDARRELAARLRAMAAHPMATLEREWSDVARDLRTAAAVLTEVPQWTPVAGELPKSGVPVLAYYLNPLGNSRRVRAVYAAPRTLELGCDQEPWDGCEWDEEADVCYCPEGWYEWNEEEDTHWRISDEVTHWMPLPAAPDDRVTPNPRSFVAEPAAPHVVPSEEGEG